MPDATVIRHDQREIPSETREALEGMGYQVVPNSWGNLGDVQLIKADGETIEAAADNRGRGVALTLP